MEEALDLSFDRLLMMMMKVNELEISSSNITLRNLYRGITEFKKKVTSLDLTY